MVDKSTKPIEAIAVGDRVLAYDEASGIMSPSEVVALHAPVLSESHLVINGFLRVTAVHPFLTKGRWLQAGRLKVGDTLTMADGSQTRITEIRREAVETMVYNFSVAMGTFVAEGVIVHNKDLPYEQQPCQDCEE